jgi:uncharacterized membrane protein YidH (DUF202 family)
MTKTIGMILIVVGIIGLVWGGITYTRTEKAVDLGPVEINTQSRKTLPVPPLIGGAALVAGIALLAAPKAN